MRKFPRAVFGVLLGFGAVSLSLNAQIVLPDGLYRWDRGAGTQSWSDGANWSHSTNDNEAPSDDGAAFFSELAGKTHEDREEISFGSDVSVGSLWFNSWTEKSPAYTLAGGAGAMLTLGKGLANDAQLITVLGFDWSRETRILADTIALDANAGDNLRITNQSYGGLLIGGRSWGEGIFNIGSHAIQVFGGDELGVYSGAATHINSAIHGSGDISVYGHRAQVILSGNNANWTGDLVVKNWPNIAPTTEYGSGSLAILKDNAAVSAANRIIVERNGALVLRHSTNASTNTDDASGLTISAKEIRITGNGSIRNGGASLNGALVSEAGNNTITSDIYFVFGGNPRNMWVSAYEGSTLTITGRIRGFGGDATGNYTGPFVKGGSGTVILERQNGQAGNEWSFATLVRQGELRIKGSEFALAGGFHYDEDNLFGMTVLEFGGGVLGLEAVDANGDAVDFTRRIGYGSGMVHWGAADGSGGFVARGNGPQTVNLEWTWDNSGIMEWGLAGFMGSGKTGRGALMLGSTNFDNYLIWKNAIYFGNHSDAPIRADGTPEWAPQRTIRVIEGVAEMQGAITGHGYHLLKLGEGLLRLTSEDSNYVGLNPGEVVRTEIAAGALQGASNNLDFTNIVLRGGVYMPNMDNIDDGIVTATLGTGGGQFRWLDSSGGFAAGEDDTTIRIGIDPVTTPLAWGDEHFVGGGRELILGHSMSGATLFWDKALATNGAQTVRVARGRHDFVDYDAVLKQSVSGSGLTIVGDGRLALRATNALNSFTVLGAMVTLDDAGALGNAGVFVREAGTLTLDNSSDDLAGRLGASSTLTLDGGSFRYLKGSRSTETLGNLHLAGGSNTIEIEATGAMVMEFAGFQRNDDDRVTLDLMSNAVFSSSGVRLKFPGAQAAFATVGDISPWATVNGTDWASQSGNGTVTRLTNYVTNAPGTAWTATSNINIGSANYTLDLSRSIRSLRIGKGAFNLSGRALTLNSGGLLFAAGEAGKLSGGGSLTTASGGTIYAHVYGGAGGTAEINAQVTGTNIDFVKTGPETLRLTSDGTSNFRNIYVHGGRLELDLGINGRINTTGEIIVGDHSGKDVLRLPKYDNQLIGKPDVLLRGGKRGDGEAVLEFSFDRDELLSTGRIQAATHRLNRLKVDGLGVIDFRGGDAGHANYLYIDELVFTEGSKLIIRDWFEYEDYLLIKRTAAHAELFSGGSGFTRTEPPIEFEGYGGSVKWTHYNDDYWEVTPFGRVGPVPEPSTYGAILGATGLGLLAWRRRKRAK